MAVGGRIAVVFVGVVVGAVTADAEMMPMSVADVVCLPSAFAASPRDLQSTSLSASVGHPDLADLSFLPIVLPPEVRSQADTACATPLIVKDEQDSLGLCLFALLGLGLCKSAPYVRKFSFGTIPEWYHTGGPFQVGHSQVISPACLYQTPVRCFIQPDPPTEDPMRQYRPEAIECLWRTCQFTPAVLASRAPPCVPWTQIVSFDNG